MKERIMARWIMGPTSSTNADPLLDEILGGDGSR
jgi:hypothetical protein